MLLICFFVGKAHTRENPKNQERTAWTDHERRPSKAGGKEPLDYFFSSLFIMHRGHERGFSVVLSYSKRIFFGSRFSFTLKIQVLPWTEGSEANSIKDMHKSGSSTLVRTWLVPILHWILKVADKSQQIWRFKNQTKFSSAATNTIRIVKN